MQSLANQDISLHFVNGQLWCCSGGTVSSFMEEKDNLIEKIAESKIGRIKILGTYSNVLTIKTLLDASFISPSKGNFVVDLAGATFDDKLQDENVPLQYLFSQLDRIDFPASVGGWHRATIADWLTYSIIAKRITQPPEYAQDSSTVAVDSLLVKHPSWPAFSFIPSLNRSSAWHLLSLIIDPRWWVNVLFPNRRNRLYNYLGLNKQQITKELKNRENGTSTFHKPLSRVGVVLSTWAGSLDPNLELERYRRHYFWNVALGYDAPCVGLLRASQHLIDFICDVWLQGMAPLGRELFVPKYFFKDLEIAQVFEKHRLKFPSRCL